MTTIDKMAEALVRALRILSSIVYFREIQPHHIGAIREMLKYPDNVELKAIVSSSDKPNNAALKAYNAEKALLEKTQDWHEHGMIAPSCVGCPTAEAVIREDMVMVRREMIIGTIKTLEYIMESDKSEKYEYGEPRADGVEPKTGQRFLTPSELALAELAHLHGLGFVTGREQ